jgi:SPX domain protein involved in polyphosphate accumulation
MNMRVPQNARLEIKFCAYEVQLHTLLHYIHLNRACFKMPFPDRWVNNIYFDMHNYHAFAENISGASSRTKVRYRWYGETVEPDVGVLEIKCKRNYFGWKHRYTVSAPPYKSGYSLKDIQQALLEQLPIDGQKWLNGSPFPIILNRYYRSYFLSSDRKIRVTLDTKQAVWDQRFKSFPNFVHKANLQRALVVEVKFDRNDRALASQILQGIPLRVSKNSKYINGVMVVNNY